MAEVLHSGGDLESCRASLEVCDANLFVVVGPKVSVLNPITYGATWRLVTWISTLPLDGGIIAHLAHAAKPRVVLPAFATHGEVPVLCTMPDCIVSHAFQCLTAELGLVATTVGPVPDDLGLIEKMVATFEAGGDWGDMDEGSTWDGADWRVGSGKPGWGLQRPRWICV